MVLCKIDIEEKSDCKNCCKYCNNLCERKCVFLNTSLDCGNKRVIQDNSYSFN